jgi:hypothetical protein
MSTIRSRRGASERKGKEDEEELRTADERSYTDKSSSKVSLRKSYPLWGKCGKLRHRNQPASERNPKIKDSPRPVGQHSIQREGDPIQILITIRSRRGASEREEKEIVRRPAVVY